MIWIRIWHWFLRHLVWILAAGGGCLLFTAVALPLVLDWLEKVRQISPAGMASALRFAERFNNLLIESFLAIWVFALGASLASFLNVVAYRLPRGQSILGRSQCPVCRAQLTFAENFPVFGWIGSLGRCRYCHVSIPARYLYVELALGLVVLGLYLVDLRSSLAPRDMLPGEDGLGLGTAVFRWGAHCLLAGYCVTAVLARLDRTSLPPAATWVAAGLYLGWGSVCRWLGGTEFPWDSRQLLGLLYGVGLGTVWAGGSAAVPGSCWRRWWGLIGWILGGWLAPLAALLAAVSELFAAKAIQQRLPLLWSQMMQTLACLFMMLVLAPAVEPVVESLPLAWSGLAMVLGVGAVGCCARLQSGGGRAAATATVTLTCLGLLPAAATAWQDVSPPQDLPAERLQFQNQEIIPSRFAGWIFPLNSPPRLIWRDVDAVRRLGRNVDFRVRWFDGQLQEHAVPQSSGRWIAWLEGEAPNGTPFRRAFTFYALPEKIELAAGPDLTVAFPNFPGPAAPASWGDHRAEIEKAGREFVTRAFLDSERGAILVAGIAEAEPLGRPRRYLESTTVANDEQHLKLKLKLQGADQRVRPLQPPRLRSEPAVVLREGEPSAAGVPDSARAQIAAFCAEWHAASGVPFVTVVARRGVVIIHQSFGHNGAGQPLPLDERCWIASLSKTVTALVFSQFVEQGLVALDAPLSTVFPDYPANDPHVPTFRQCLNHTSGLSGHGEWGGMHNPHLENIVLNGIDVVRPGVAHAYSGLGFELVAKAMEQVAGKSATRIYHEHLFQPLGFGDVVVGNASSDVELTAWELATLGQWICNQGSYGDQEFISPATLAEFLPRAVAVPGAQVAQGLGLHAVYHRKPGADPHSERPEDLLFSPRTVGHGSFSGCILVVDPEQQLVIAQARREFKPADNEWYPRFFQTVAAALQTAAPQSSER